MMRWVSERHSVRLKRLAAFGVFVHDAAWAGLSWALAFLLRFNFVIPPENTQSLKWSLGIVVLLHALVFWRYGLHKSLWRYVGLPDLRNIISAVFISSLVSAMALFLYHRLNQIPRSVFAMHPILLAGALAGSRFLYRSWKDGHLISIRNLSATPVLVLGAGHAASLLLRDLSRGGGWRVVGLLDDDPNKKNQMLLGVPVLGCIAELPRIAQERGVRRAIIALPSASPARRRHVVETAAAAGLSVFTVPALDDIMMGRVAVSRVRPVELDDLLGRGRITLDDDGLHQLLTGRPVLVTGAGGSIGAELCRQIARFDPSVLLLVDAGEFALYQIEQEFREKHPQVKIVTLTADVRDAERMEEIFSRHRPEVVFHAAAYKHVPLMENDNCWEAVKNNVGGTLCLARAAQSHGVAKFVLISSDKAVNPTNVMGATKRLAEIVCQALQAPDGTRFVTVRFGNVLGSTGSVIPKFREQIARGGPLTVTHPDITRYFMLIPEAAQLVLQAGLMGRGGEIFVLDMGEPVRILDLAKDMIRLSGLTEDEIKIEITGLRPGEKLKEELLADQEHTLPTPHPKVRVARARSIASADWDDARRWVEFSGRVSDEDVRRGLRRWIPEYVPARHAPANGASGGAE